MQQEVVLAMLTKEPSYGYELRARLREALGPLGDAMNAGHVYVALTRLEKAGLLAVERSADGADRSDRKVYALTPAGQQRVAEWIAEVSWPRPDLAEFHLKLIAAASAGRADPLTIVDTQRRELLRRLRDTQRAAMAEPEGSAMALCWRASCSGFRPTCAGLRQTINLAICVVLYILVPTYGTARTGAVVERHVRRSSVRITRVHGLSGYGLQAGDAVPPGVPGTRAAR